jgi:hypothetical protein
VTTEAPAPPSSRPGPADVAATVARLRTTFASGRTRDVAWRKRQLEGLERLLTDNEPAVAAALEQDLGRKPFEAWLADIASTIGEAMDAAKNGGKWTKRKQRFAVVRAAARPRLGGVRALRAELVPRYLDPTLDEAMAFVNARPKPTRPDSTAIIYPPYTEKAWKLARRLF